MTILAALKYDDGFIRLVCGERWLLWSNEEFEVYRKRRGSKATLLIRTQSEADAVQLLIEPEA